MGMGKDALSLPIPAVRSGRKFKDFSFSGFLSGFSRTI
jgi:hypothetical protein